MKISITSKREVYSLEVTENKVTSTLTLGKSHDIVTKGEDVNDLANIISLSYRNQVGKGATGRELLKLIRAELKDQINEKEKDKE